MAHREFELGNHAVHDNARRLLIRNAACLANDVHVNVRDSGDQRAGTRRPSPRQLQTLAQEVAASLPGVSHGRPFVEKLDVYKVGDKVFMIVTDDPDERIITLKADPDVASALRDRYQAVTYGRYLDKGHWISVAAGRGITSHLITELVKTSYQLVVAKMPVHGRPKKVPKQ